MNTTPLPSTRFVLVRNPYFHRVDSAGRQLPYIDRDHRRHHRRQADPGEGRRRRRRPAGALPALRQLHVPEADEKRNQYHVRLWEKALGSQIALYPNLNAEDAEWRKLMRDVRFRRALSLGINRHEINEVVYFGLGKESSNTVLQRSRSVPARVPRGVDEVRRQGGQRAARLDRPHAARRRGTAPPA